MKIKELLTQGRPTFSFEFFPPKSEEAAFLTIQLTFDDNYVTFLFPGPLGSN